MTEGVRFAAAAPPAAEADLAAAEEELGFPLPAEYRAFLREHNGGTLADNDYPAFDGPPGVSVERFLGVPPAGTPPRDRRYADDATLVERWLDHRDRLGGPLLPVADANERSDLLCLSLADGSATLWWHEVEEPIRLAPSLADFLAGLRYEPPPPPPSSATELWYDVETRRRWVEQGIARELVPHRQPNGTLLVPAGREIRHGRLFEGWRAIGPDDPEFERWEREIEAHGQ